jgi:hypothetical protein
MANRVERILEIPNAHIFYRNFSGVEKKYNPAGNRNFCVEIPEDATIDNTPLYQVLLEEGWNVRLIPPRNEGDAPMHYIQVNVSYKNVPPNIWMIAGRRKTRLDEGSVDSLDYAEIKTVDLVINPYNWEPGRVKAYLKTMYIEIVQDAFADKWAALEGPDM